MEVQQGTVTTHLIVVGFHTILEQHHKCETMFRIHRSQARCYKIGRLVQYLSWAQFMLTSDITAAQIVHLGGRAMLTQCGGLSGVLRIVYPHKNWNFAKRTFGKSEQWLVKMIQSTTDTTLGVTPIRSISSAHSHSQSCTSRSEILYYTTKNGA